MRILQRVVDKWNGALIRIELFFTSDEKKRKDLLIAYALWSLEGRKMLGDAMIGGIKCRLPM